MSFLGRLAAALCLAVLAPGCAHHPPTPLGPLEWAAGRAARGPADARTTALSGWKALLVDSDAARASAAFEAALGQDAREPWALLGAVAMAERRGDVARQVEAALDLCERAPSHPLSAVAARVVLESIGLSSQLDEVVSRRSAALVEGPLPADAALQLRAALAAVAWARRLPGETSRWLGQAGVPTRFTLLGPFSPHSRLPLPTPLPLERDGVIPAASGGPLGSVRPRILDVPDGLATFDGETLQADLLVLAVDAAVPEDGDYLLQTVSPLDHVVLLGGSPVLSRLTNSRPASITSSAALRLTAGSHRLLVRLATERRRGPRFSLSLAPADGSPARVAFSPATGAPGQYRPALSSRQRWVSFPGAAEVQAALSPEVGSALAGAVAAWSASRRDNDGARRALASVPAEAASAWRAMLAARLELEDPLVPPQVTRGRATRELEVALQKDPELVPARLAAAEAAQDEGRGQEALELVRRSATASPRLLWLQARLESQLDLGARAEQTAAALLKALPGHCGALELLLDAARRRDAVALVERRLTALQGCERHPERALELLKERGALKEAIDAQRAQLLRAPASVGEAFRLHQLLTAEGQHQESARVLEASLRLWPRQAGLWRALGDSHAARGSPDEALAAWEAALQWDGGDLTLRRLVSRLRTGKELLEAYAVSTREALKAAEADPGRADGTSAYVLDAAAIEAFPDGTLVDRVHIIQRALTQAGVEETAEVRLPAGAQVLALRTLKADGTVLEPERIDEKEAISLPGVEVGDAVEYEYLLAHPSRGPGLTGFTAGNFYFRTVRQANNVSTYVVLGQPGTELAVDAHNMQVGPVTEEGGRPVFRHVERRVPPFLPEPGGPRNVNEVLPFVAVGAGARGLEGLVTGLGDAVADRAQVTAAVERFARDAAGQATGEDAVKAIHQAVHQALSGPDTGLSTPAAASALSDRGSRTLLLKAALEALGLEARLAVVRTFSADPAPYLFPTDGLLPYVCVRVSLPDGKQVWLDTAVRFSPYGELPPEAAGGREAYLVPEPGRPLQAVRTPPARQQPMKEIRLTLALSEAGELTGTGEETYLGYEAAHLGEALESMPKDQRSQALEGALARYFGGASLSGSEVEVERRVGGVTRVRYALTAPRFAVEDGPGRLVAPYGLTFPVQLGRRYLATAVRQTPLYIESVEQTHTVATVKLPPGWSLQRPAEDVRLVGPSGTYRRQESQQDGQVTVEEHLDLQQVRLAPAEYDSFGRFAGELDLTQGRDLVFEKAAGR